MLIGHQVRKGISTASLAVYFTIVEQSSSSGGGSAEKGWERNKPTRKEIGIPSSAFAARRVRLGSAVRDNSATQLGKHPSTPRFIYQLAFFFPFDLKDGILLQAPAHGPRSRTSTRNCNIQSECSCLAIPSRPPPRC